MCVVTHEVITYWKINLIIHEQQIAAWCSPSLYPRPTKLEGVYWIHHVRPSVCPSVRLSVDDMVTKWPPGDHIGFFGFQTLTLVWPWIWTPNLSGTILMYMCRSLSIFSNVNFKMAARQPYWILWFPDSNFIVRQKCTKACFEVYTKFYCRSCYTMMSVSRNHQVTNSHLWGNFFIHGFVFLVYF